MAHRTHVTLEEARIIGDDLGVQWDRIDVERFRKGMELELEHGIRDPDVDISKNDLTVSGKLAFEHLKEYPQYYDRMKKMEYGGGEDLPGDLEGAEKEE